VERTGFLQPILVAPQEDGMYRIIDGEHRYEIAKLCDMETIPAVVLTKERDEDFQKFQTVRMNKLRGRLNKLKLRHLVEDLVERHTVTEVAERLLFDKEEDIAELIQDARKFLPTDELKEKFDAAVDDVKTLDDLTTLLNRLYLQYGESLDAGFMIFDFGGQDHFWVRLNSRNELRKIKKKADLVRNSGYNFASALSLLLDSLNEDFLLKHVDKLKSVYSEEDDGF